MSGYTPLPEPIVQEHGVFTAAVYGRVWSYCQIGGMCTAAIETIAKALAISTPTVQRHLNVLVASGYLSKQGGGKSGKPSTYRQTGKWVMGDTRGQSASSTQVDLSDRPQRRGASDLDLSDRPLGQEVDQGSVTEIDGSITEIEGVDLSDRGGRSQRSTRYISSSSSSSTTDVPEEEEALRTSAPSRTRPAPKPASMRRTAPPSTSSVALDPADALQTAVLEACGLDAELTRSKVLEQVVDVAARLKARKFTATQVREAGEAWPECFPDRAAELVEPPHPQQLAEWVGRRRAAEALRKASGSNAPRRAAADGRRAAPAFHGIVPMIER